MGVPAPPAAVVVWVATFPAPPATVVVCVATLPAPPAAVSLEIRSEDETEFLNTLEHPGTQARIPPTLWERVRAGSTGMGAGASLGEFETVLPDPIEGQDRFFCHACSVSFYVDSDAARDETPSCTACGGEFVEACIAGRTIDVAPPSAGGGALEDLLPFSTRMAESVANGQPPAAGSSAARRLEEHLVHAERLLSNLRELRELRMHIRMAALSRVGGNVNLEQALQDSMDNCKVIPMIIHPE